VSLLRAVREHYGSFRSKNKLGAAMLASPRRAVLSALGLAAVTGAALFWLRKKKPGQRPPRPSESEQKQRETAELCRALDAALSERGAPRPTGTPPLTHVKSLVQLGHPVAEPALRLTERYLRARFGHDAFTLDERREFLRQVRELARPPRTERVTPAA
jgi:hypothetical protein